MDDRPGRRALIAVGVHVGHDVVPQLAFVLRGFGEVDVVDGGPQLGDLLGRDRQAQFLLGLGQGHPQPPPGRMDRLRRPEPDQLLRGVPADQRILILIVAQDETSDYKLEMTGRAVCAAERIHYDARATGPTGCDPWAAAIC